MTRLVAAFFLCVTFLLTVTWIVPGARPPEMTAVATGAQKPAATPRVAIVEPLALVDAQRPAAESRPIPAAFVPAALAPATTVAPAPPRAAQASACDVDPIRCMLDGRPAAADPTEVTGSVVTPRKAPAKPLHHQPAHLQPAQHHPATPAAARTSPPKL
jgi:hypothetical protein